MITKVVFGRPFQTEAVTGPVAAADRLDHFHLEEGPGRLTFTCPLEPEEMVYGLGETTGKLNKRGSRAISFNTDTANHAPTNPSLYSSHNFLIVEGQRHFGVFFDTPARTVFEIDWEGSGLIRVVCETADVAVYQLEADSAYAVAKEFLRAIGPSYIPPLWAFGYGQSRCGYKAAQDYRDVLAGHKNAGVPLDYICMDIDYMDRFMDFSVNPGYFPDLKAFAEEMLAEGVHLVPIVDAGVKVEPGNPVYEDGVKQDVFCRNREGKLFRAGVWPGMTHFTDFLDPKARAWFGSQYRFYTEKGIEGFWNDMNEPAIFYSEYTRGPKKLTMFLDMAFGKYREDRKARNLQRDYRSFFHRVDGERVCHYDVHNIYGYLMTRASSEGLQKLLPHRFLLFSRSSYIGAGRYGGLWTGDNSSCWEHILLQLRQMPSLNMCGFLYSGADTGGFMGNATRELLLRWLAVSVFTPLMRNHSGGFTGGQECYRFGDTEDFRSIITLRYRLLPYLYSEYMKAALTGDMFIKPLGFLFPADETARQIEDQLMVGGSVMIAPIITEGAVTRRVYLPQDMTMVKYDGTGFACTEAKMGHMTVEAKLNEVVFFVLKDKLLPVGEAIANTAQMDISRLTLLGSGAVYELYADDGLTREYTMENIRILKK